MLIGLLVSVGLITLDSILFKKDENKIKEESNSQSSQSSIILEEKEKIEKLYVNKDLKVMGAPNEVAAILGELKKGDTVLVYNNSIKNWLEVRYEGRIGYIKIDFLSEEKIKVKENNNKKKIEEESKEESKEESQEESQEEFYIEELPKDYYVEETSVEEGSFEEVPIEEPATTYEEINKEETTYYTTPEITAADMQNLGIVSWGGYRFTWYSEKALPGYDLPIPGRHVDENGYVCDENNYICLASDSLSKGTVVATPLGKEGKIYDCGTGCDDILDIYVSW